MVNGESWKRPNIAVDNIALMTTAEQKEPPTRQGEQRPALASRRAKTRGLGSAWWAARWEHFDPKSD